MTIADDPRNPVDADLAGTDDWDSPDNYGRCVYISGVVCSECETSFGNVPIPIGGDFGTDDPDYRIPVRCPNGHLVPFSFEVFDDEDDDGLPPGVRSL